MPARSIYYQAHSWIDKPDHLQAVADIKVPTLLVWGEQDIPQPISRAEPMLDTMPDATMVRVPNAGHTVSLENPDLVNEALLTFLGRVHSS